LATGTLRMWNAERGYGFIQNEEGGPDVFLHIIALRNAGIDPDSMKKGERLTFDIEPTQDGRTRAGNVRKG
jgi:cold shock protein